MNMQLVEEIKTAYADHVLGYEKGKGIRNLDFRASQSTSPSEACEILKEALGKDFGYNEFHPNLLLHFPEDCKVTLAREGSVCIYVKTGAKKLPQAGVVMADEMDKLGNEIRCWWD